MKSKKNSLLEKIMAYSLPTLLVGSLVLGELSYDREKLLMEDTGRTYNVFTRGEEIIFRDISGGPSILYLDLIGDDNKGFQYAKQQAPIRGVGSIIYNSNHPNWEKLKETYGKLFKEYKSR